MPSDKTIVVAKSYENVCQMAHLGRKRWKCWPFKPLTQVVKFSLNTSEKN